MKKIRFIHIPKTAGTSFLQFMHQNNVKFLIGSKGNSRITGHHKFASFWKNEDSFKITIVRNPYTRIVSYYNYMVHTRSRFDADTTFEQFIKEKLDIINQEKTPSIWTPQVRWMYDNDICLIDKTFKLENNFEEEIKKFFNIENKFPKANKSTHDDYSSYYTPELKNLVANYFKDDFEILGYNI